jgi:hypothetical protein
MIFTLLFVILYFSNKHKYINDQDDDIELFEVDNILNQSRNPAIYDCYWDKVQVELSYLFFKFVIITLGALFGLYLDIGYVQYMYLSN